MLVTFHRLWYTHTQKKTSSQNFTSSGCCKRESFSKSPRSALKSLQEYNTYISRISLFIGIFFPQLCTRARVSVCVCVCVCVRLWDSCWQSSFMVFSPFGFNSSFQAARYSVPSPPPQLHLLWYSAGLKNPAVKKKKKDRLWNKIQSKNGHWLLKFGVII